MTGLKHISLAGVARKFGAPFFRPEFLEMTNKCLAVLLALLIIYLLADTVIFRPSTAVKRMTSGISFGKSDVKYPISMPRPNPTEYSHYSSILSEKQVFGRSISAGSEVVPETPVDIGLVGVIMGARPQAIIENKQNQAVYYVYKGERFENFIVEEVSAYKVALYRDGERIELVL